MLLGGYMGKRAALKQSAIDLFDYCNSRIVKLDDAKGQEYLKLSRGRALLLDEQITIKKNRVIANTLSLLGPSRKSPDKKSLRKNLSSYLSNKISLEYDNPYLKEQFIKNFIYDWTTKKRFKTNYYFKLGNILPPTKKFVISKNIFINKASRIKNLGHTPKIKPLFGKNIDPRISPVLLPDDTVLGITISEKTYPDNFDDAQNLAHIILDLINLFYCYDKEKVYLINAENYSSPTSKTTCFVSMDSAAVFQHFENEKKFRLVGGLSWPEMNETFFIKTDELKNISTNLQVYQAIRKRKDELCIKAVTAFSLIGDALRNKDIKTSFVQIMIVLDSLLSQESNDILDRYIHAENAPKHRLFSNNKQNKKWGWKKTQIADIVSYLVAFNSDGFLTTKQFMLKMGMCRDEYVHDGKQSFTEGEYKVFANVTVSFIGKLFMLLLVDPKLKTTDDLWTYCHQYLIIQSKETNNGIMADDVEVSDEELTVTDPANLLDKWLKDHS